MQPLRSEHYFMFDPRARHGDPTPQVLAREAGRDDAEARDAVSRHHALGAVPPHGGALRELVKAVEALEAVLPVPRGEGEAARPGSPVPLARPHGRHVGEQLNDAAREESRRGAPLEERAYLVPAGALVVATAPVGLTVAAAEQGSGTG